MLKYFGDELVITSSVKWSWTILMPHCRISLSFEHVCSGGRKGYSLNEKVKKMCLERFQWAPAEMKSGPFSSQSGKECVASSPAAGSQSSHLSWQCYRASIFHIDKSSFGVSPVGMAKVSWVIQTSLHQNGSFHKSPQLTEVARIKIGVVKCLSCFWFL